MSGNLWPIELRRFGTVVDLESRQPVFDEGQAADRVFLLVAGAVKITRRPTLGREEIILELVWPGSPFGDEGLAQGRKWLGSARTLARSRILELDREGLAEALRESPTVALDLMQRMARRQGIVHERILELSWTNSRDRIESAVERLGDLTAGRSGGGFDERDVASHALVSRRAVRSHPAFKAR